MADEEKGLRWWLRYVVVPLLGGGGVIAIIVTSMTKTDPKPNSTQTTVKKAEPTPELAEQARSDDHLNTYGEDFALYKTGFPERMDHGTAKFPLQQKFFVKWRFKASVVNETLILREQLLNNTTKEVQIALEGKHNYYCAIPGEFNISILGKKPDGNLILYDTYRVKCE